MPVLCLIANPAEPMFDPRLAQQIQHEIGGELDWLHHGVAADIIGPRAADPAAVARALIGTAPVDVALVSGAKRRKKLLIADMDSTMIEQECIDELADAIGIKPEIAAITERAMRGELDFEAALKTRVALLKGLNRKVIEAVRREHITLTPGGRALVQTMKAYGAYTALISGGFTFFAEFFGKRIGFDEFTANTLIFDGDVLAGTVAEPIVDRHIKLRRLQELVSERGITLEETLAVGDGANDLDMIRASGLGRGVSRQAGGGRGSECARRARRSDGAAVPARLHRRRDRSLKPPSARQLQPDIAALPLGVLEAEHDGRSPPFACRIDRSLHIGEFQHLLAVDLGEEETRQYALVMRIGAGADAGDHQPGSSRWQGVGAAVRGIGGGEVETEEIVEGWRQGRARLLIGDGYGFGMAGRSVGRQPPERHGGSLLGAVAKYLQWHGLPNRRLGDQTRQIVHVGDRFAVELQDDVPLFQYPRGGAGGRHVRDHGAVAVRAAESRSDVIAHILNADADPAPTGFRRMRPADRRQAWRGCRGWRSRCRERRHPRR